MQQIIIEDGLARLVETNVVREVPLADLEPHLITYRPTTFPVLPDHTRAVFYDPNAKQGAVLVSRAPKISHFDVHYDVGHRGLTTEDIARIKPGDRDEFDLSLPWLHFVYHFRTDVGAPTETFAGDITRDFAIDGAYLYWTRDPIRSLNDHILPAKIPNINTSGSICWGYTRADTTSLSARIDHQVKTFEHTTFNNHLNMPRPNGVLSYDQWERESRDNPLYYLNWEEWQNLANAGHTVQSLLQARGVTIDGTGDAALDLPEPPRLFTVGRAREWARAIEPQQRRVILAAIQHELTETTPEPTDG